MEALKSQSDWKTVPSRNFYGMFHSEMTFSDATSSCLSHFRGGAAIDTLVNKFEKIVEAQKSPHQKTILMKHRTTMMM